MGFSESVIAAFISLFFLFLSRISFIIERIFKYKFNVTSLISTENARNALLGVVWFLVISIYALFISYWDKDQEANSYKQPVKVYFYFENKKEEFVGPSSNRVKYGKEYNNWDIRLKLSTDKPLTDAYPGVFSVKPTDGRNQEARVDGFQALPWWNVETFKHQDITSPTYFDLLNSGNDPTGSKLTLNTTPLRGDSLFKNLPIGSYDMCLA